MMAIILLDEDIYEECIGDPYRDELLHFVEKYFNLDVAVFHPFCNVGNMLNKKNLLATIQLKLLKMGKIEIFDKNQVIMGSTPLDNGLNFSKEFLGEINYLIDKYKNVIIPVAPSKHCLNIKRLGDSVYIINHVFEEIDSNIPYFILNGIFMKDIKNPTVDDPLPNKELCKKFHGVQEKLVKSGENKLQVYSAIAKEVASRNTYSFNKEVSYKNRNKSKSKKKNKREIYDSGKKVYISTDFESGCFEVYNKNGKHQGEYSYTNQLLSSSDKTGGHDIIV